MIALKILANKRFHDQHVLNSNGDLMNVTGGEVSDDLQDAGEVSCI